MQNYQKLETIFFKITNLHAIEALLDWDNQVVMPPKGTKMRASELSTLNEIIHELQTSSLLANLLQKAEEENLTDLQRVNLSLMRRNYIHAKAVPIELVTKFTEATIQCEGVWREAKQKSDFTLIASDLENVVNLVKEISLYKAEALQCEPYEALLDMYDPGRKTAEIDHIFTRLENFLPSFIEEVRAKKTPSLPLEISVEIQQQETLAKFLAKRIGLPEDCSRIDQSAHPFSTGTKYDLRITSRYNKNEIISGLAAIAHEVGHALYEMNLPEELIYQPIGQTCSMTLHESQSLFVEMQLFCRKEFMYYLCDLLKTKLNLQHKALEPENLYREINNVEPSFIRVDADEVTYPLHIIMRYKLEKALIAGDITVRDIPWLWNESMQQYLGITPANDAQGCLQDIHWVSGSFGYFPCYSLGAILAAQLYSVASKAEPLIAENLMKGDFILPIEWLKRNFHQLASTKSVDQIISHATGEPLNVNIYIDYLKNKYLGDM